MLILQSNRIILPFHECFVTTNADRGGDGANVEEAILLLDFFSLSGSFKILSYHELPKHMIVAVFALSQI